MSEFTPNNPQRSDNTFLIVAAIGTGLLACLCIGAIAFLFMTGLVSYFTLQSGPSVGPTFGPVFSATTQFGTPVPVPTANLTPPPPEHVEEVLAALEEAVVPYRDRYDLAARFLGITDATVEAPGEYNVGDREEFWVENGDTDEVVRVQAELAYRNDVVYMWVEVGQSYDEEGLQRSADRFAEETYPTNRANFGSEPNPGVDSDPRIHVLHSSQLGFTTAGYFYSPSQYPAEVVEYSNEKEIFFINISNTPPGDDYYDSVLAHEFQHMIHHNVDANEEGFINEGMSELAAYLNGFGPSGFTYSYLSNTDIQLTGWPEGGDPTPNYGGGFLFNLYYHDQFGSDALTELASHDQNGLRGVDEALEESGEGLTADEFFANWAIANYLNDTSIAPEYGYAEINLQTPGVAETVFSYPHSSSTQVYQHGVDYIVLDEPGELNFVFDGSLQVQIVPTPTANTDGDPNTDDSFAYWSQRYDQSDSYMTRTVDLTGVSSATLTYDLWYWIEDEYDYGLISVSTDGTQWTILSTDHTTDSDPHGNSYGPGYTGQSSFHNDATPDGWVEESIDLSAYAGQEVLLRFELLSDDAVNQPGMVVDNICISEIDWCDDAESADAGWESMGWVRHNNILPQVFSVQVIMEDASGNLQVVTMELNELNHGELTITSTRDNPAVIVIVGLTRYTSQPAVYSYSLTP